ncbi:MAG: hypothetical protein IPJ19_21660 [Planctomycetes bacterium]|nr:hypothetical protein [Planctomycetota bacterium]
MRHFSRGLMQMQEAERMQIAADLGDDITQLLCALLARCELLVARLPAHESRSREEATEFAALLRTTASSVHDISARLRPHGLEILGLASALRGVAAEFSERMGVPIEVRCAKLAARLPADTELTIYRVLLEALRNVEQHARARHACVTLHCRGDAVQLVVKDDGIGFDASDLPSQALRVGSIGLLGMRERAMAVGGSLQLKSTASSGTEVLLSVPLTRKPAATG